MKTELMFFPEDKTVNGVLTFEAGKTYEIPVETGSVARWLKRGAVIVERGYDPGKHDDSVVDVNAGEVIHTGSEVTLESVEVVAGEESASEDEALAALGGDEEVANEPVKKENKKAKKSSK